MENRTLKQECIKRLEILKLDTKVINEFKENNRVYLSKINKDTTDVIFDNKIMALIESLESKKTIKIYHIILFENKIYLLSVHTHKEIWGEEKKDLKRGFTVIVLCDATAKIIMEFVAKDAGIEVEGGKIKRVVM